MDTVGPKLSRRRSVRVPQVPRIFRHGAKIHALHVPHVGPERRPQVGIARRMRRSSFRGNRTARDRPVPRTVRPESCRVSLLIICPVKYQFGLSFRRVSNPATRLEVDAEIPARHQHACARLRPEFALERNTPAPARSPCRGSLDDRTAPAARSSMKSAPTAQ